MSNIYSTRRLRECSPSEMASGCNVHGVIEVPVCSQSDALLVQGGDRHYGEAWTSRVVYPQRQGPVSYARFELENFKTVSKRSMAPLSSYEFTFERFAEGGGIYIDGGSVDISMSNVYSNSSLCRELRAVSNSGRFKTLIPCATGVPVCSQSERFAVSGRDLHQGSVVANIPEQHQLNRISGSRPPVSN